MRASELKKQAKNNVHQLQETVKEGYGSAVAQAMDSGKEVMDYVKTNPLKAVFYGILGYFAVKAVIEKL